MKPNINFIQVELIKKGFLFSRRAILNITENPTIQKTWYRLSNNGIKKLIYKVFKKVVIIFLPFASIVYGNNIIVSNVQLTQQNIVDNYINVAFDLSWENSWRFNSVNQGISQVAIKTGGTGYTTAPKIYIGSQGAINWMGSTVVNKGDLIVFNGNYYIISTSGTTHATSGPTHTNGTQTNGSAQLLYVSGIQNGGGSGATALAITNGGIVTSVVLTSSGAGYVSVPSVIIASTTAGSGAEAEAHIQTEYDAAWVFIKFRVGAADITLSPGATNSGNLITVQSTLGLRKGMPVSIVSGSGSFSPGTVITSVNSTTTFSVSSSPITALSINTVIIAQRIWEHALLNNVGNSSGTGTPALVQVGLWKEDLSFSAVSNPALGAFFYRSQQGVGTTQLQQAKLRWNYGANLVGDNDIVEVQVFAIEMVYVPSSAFYLGSGGAETGSFTNGSWINGFTVPYLVSSEGVINIAPNAGSLWGTNTNGNQTIGPQGTLPTSFPKGHAGFFCMKYELGQGQYRDFLNNITRLQQSNRVATAVGLGITAVSNIYVLSNSSNTSNNRNGIRCSSAISSNSPISFFCDLNSNGIGNGTTDGEWIACNWLSWGDGTAYADWSSLRPMSELEFEKASRGYVGCNAYEYAWGNSSIHTGSYQLNNVSQNNEWVSKNNYISFGNACYNSTNNNVNGPYRVGIFSAHAQATTRQASGAGYYGVMELSGNLWERVVTIGNTQGRAFQNKHGNGDLSFTGNPDEPDWPGINAVGSGFRGGAWLVQNSRARISDRTIASMTDATRQRDYGFRLVRNLPVSSPE
jgi:formylglycine-generating enzyme required for sulfatase activity